MTDPVSEELERRAHAAWPWRSSLLAALTVHLLVAVGLFVAPGLHRRPLTFPSVQVRLGALAPVPAPAQGGTAGPVPSAPAVPRRVGSPPRHEEPRPQRSKPAAAPIATALPAEAHEAERPGGGETRSPGGGIAIGGGGGSTDETFPYAYYLTRLVGMIEGNWFRPPAQAGTRCRVLCRIDRSGRLLEAGVEEPSEMPAFDRAALRAVYAAAPFPPLPQGFGGTSLTVHLEFGP